MVGRRAGGQGWGGGGGSGGSAATSHVDVHEAGGCDHDGGAGIRSLDQIRSVSFSPLQSFSVLFSLFICSSFLIFCLNPGLEAASLICHHAGSARAPRHPSPHSLTSCLQLSTGGGRAVTMVTATAAVAVWGPWAGSFNPGHLTPAWGRSRCYNTVITASERATGVFEGDL